MRRSVISRVLAALALAAASPALAQVTGSVEPRQVVLGPASNQPLPRYMSLKHDEVNMRRGPGEEHPILWVYQRRNFPVEVINEFESWRKVRDVDGAEGWISAKLLSPARFVLVEKAPNPRETRWPLLEKAAADARVVAIVEPGVVAELLRCPGDYCELKAGTYSGWMSRRALYGVLDSETIE